MAYNNYATNVLEKVPVYANIDIAAIRSQQAMVEEASKMFNPWAKRFPGQLGETITFNLRSKSEVLETLNVKDKFQAIQQRKATLSVTKEYAVTFGFSAQELTLYSADDYKGMYLEDNGMLIGTKLERYLGSLVAGNTKRFYGDGTTEITSYKQLMDANARNIMYGAPDATARIFVHPLVVPSVVDAGLRQFAPTRGDKQARSWQLGNINGVNFYTTNGLNRHQAGTAGDEKLTLTVVSVTRDDKVTGGGTGGITSITCSGASANSKASLAYDKYQFKPTTIGGSLKTVNQATFQNNWMPLPGQFVARADADLSTSAGQVTIKLGSDKEYWIYDDVSEDKTLYPNYLGRYKTHFGSVVTGMQIQCYPSHICGLLIASNSLFLCTPKLPPQPPFFIETQKDPVTGLSMRKTHGSEFGGNFTGFITDMIAGGCLLPDYAMLIMLPDNGYAGVAAPTSGIGTVVSETNRGEVRDKTVAPNGKTYVIED